MKQKQEPINDYINRSYIDSDNLLESRMNNLSDNDIMKIKNYIFKSGEHEIS